jgi:uncharacterized protein (DUF1501 family)
MAFDRRRFLIASGVTGGLAAAAGAGVFGYRELHHAASTHPLAGGGVLVVVTLYGGNDGLNTVIPVDDPAYRAARPDLAYTAQETLPLADGLALHPALTSLRTLWGQKKLAIVRGVGYPKPDHSHFRSMAIWQTASPTTTATTGWLGRWLDAAPKDPPDVAALRAISVGPTLAPLVVGESTAAAAVPTGAFKAPTGAIGDGLRLLFQPGPADGALAARVASSGAELFTVAERLTPVLASRADQTPAPSGQLDGGVPDTASPSPSAATSRATGGASRDGGDLGTQLDVVAACIRAAVPTRVYSVNLGGFDTHTDEKGTQANLLGQLDAALGRFQAAVDADPHGAAVTTVVYSEFGRRVAANGSGGTDHGEAGPVLVLGSRVQGGFYGDQPSLTRLDAGDLIFTTDFRSVYATVLEQVLGADAGAVLGTTERFPRLAFV